MSKIITLEEKEVIKKYYLSRPMSIAQVSNKFNLSNPTVGKILADIPKYPKAKIFNPTLLENFFENIDNEIKAYFLGLIIADGNVFHDGSGRQYSISITLKSEDVYILQKFKEVLQTQTSITHDGRGNCQIAIRSNIMAKDLAKYGIIPRKSLLTYLPTLISDKYMNHLLRGILDGDGSISSFQDTNGKHRHYIGYCGSHKLMQDISNYCQKLSLNKIPKVYDYQNMNLSEIKISNIHDMYIFGEWLYKDASIYLTRKRDIYNSFKKYYKLGQDNTEVIN